MQDIVRRAASEAWPLSNGMGNHRALIRVERACEAAFVRIDWRRRDYEPEQIGVRLVCLEDGAEIMDVRAVHVEREYGEYAFRAPAAGLYALYFLPCEIKGPVWFFPEVLYRKPEDGRPDPAWLARSEAPEDVCEVLALESRKPFEGFGEMETPATRGETAALLARHAGRALLFPEDREHPIWMKTELPLRWIRRGASDTFEAEALRGEYFAFQIGVYAREAIADVQVRFENPRGLAGDALTCLNAGGYDWLHRRFEKSISLEAGEILPLWFGVDVPKDAMGELGFDVALTLDGEVRGVRVRLTIGEGEAALRGDGELRKFSRLRWLNSDIGIDDEVCEGFEPVRFEGNRFHCVGRTVDFDGFGMPSAISSHFTPDGLGVREAGEEILAAPVRFRFREDASLVPLGVRAERPGAGRCVVTGGGQGDGYSLTAVTQAEFDGHLDCVLTLRADRDVTLTDIRLEVPLREQVARYMVGFGREGGRAPDAYTYHWDIDRANNMVWYGCPNAGLQIKLKHTPDVWEITNFRAIGLPESWYGGGKGRVEIAREGGVMRLSAYCGDRSLKAGESFQWRVAYLVTPMKPIDAEKQWAQRYYHTDTWNHPIPNLQEAKDGGATVVNLHQGGSLNAFINYPFLKDAELREQTDAAHALGLKYKIYYTVRELSNHAAELPALRALGEEILRGGPGFHVADHFNRQRNERMTGGPWLCEHMPEGFVPAWQQILSDGDYDSAVATVGLSRWHNYYLEGLRWLIEQAGIDGLYLDGVGYDREIMKRVRKTMDRAKSGCWIDFHSGNNFAPEYGYGNPISGYMELVPYVDRLWLGEGYDYEGKDADYWLIEISGIPFGVMSEMLQGGGNPWRGMCFGMSGRLGWQQGGDPRALWRFWDEYGIEKTRLLGWWNPDCPVKTSLEDVKASAFEDENRLLISVASWHPQAANIALACDAPNGWRAPAIEGFQPERDFAAGEPIPVEPGKGWLLIRK